MRGERWRRPLAVGLTVLFAGYGAFVLVTILGSPEFRSLLGVDREIYVGATQRWLDGEPFYYQDQVAGPYELLTGHVLYPPVALWFFVPASLLPPVLWWAVPLTVLVVVTIYHRPAVWSWPALAACIAFQWSLMLLVAGNPVVWLSAAVAAGTIRGGWAVAVLAKPSLVPFALVGARRRWWWASLLIFALACLPFGVAMWADWYQVIENARGDRVSVLYSLGDVPWLLAPIVAWMGSTRAQRSRPRCGGARP